MTMQKRSGLGRGLGSLIPQPLPATKKITVEAIAEEAPSSAASPSNAVQAFFIPVDAIDPNPQQPRHTFSAQDLEDLTNSIREHGVMQPLTVTRKDDGRYELVAGERRLRASKLAGLETVPAVVRDAATDQKLVLALIENIQRQDLNALEEAMGYRQLMDDYGFTQEEVAKKMGKARSTVANTLRLLDLPLEIRDAIASGQLAPGSARAMLSLPDTDSQLKFFQNLREEKLSTREIERRVRTGGNDTAKNPSLLGAEAELRDIFGTRVEVKKKNGQGSVAISFFSDEEYERVVAMLRRCGGSEE